jgi:hypothetical protein
MTTVRIAHTEPWPGRNMGGRGFRISSFLVVLVDDVSHRALPIWLSGPEGHSAGSASTRRFARPLADDRAQAGYWSWRAQTSTHSSSVSLRPAERMPASSVKYSSRGGAGANTMSIRAGAPLELEKAWIPPGGT